MLNAITIFFCHALLDIVNCVLTEVQALEIMNTQVIYLGKDGKCADQDDLCDDRRPLLESSRETDLEFYLCCGEDL